MLASSAGLANGRGHVMRPVGGANDGMAEPQESGRCPGRPDLSAGLACITSVASSAHVGDAARAGNRPSSSILPLAPHLPMCDVPRETAGPRQERAPTSWSTSPRPAQVTTDPPSGALLRCFPCDGDGGDHTLPRACPHGVPMPMGSPRGCQYFGIGICRIGVNGALTRVADAVGR